jgi:hypothetical protein
VHLIWPWEGLRTPQYHSTVSKWMYNW